MIDRNRHWEQLYAEQSPSQVSWYQGEPALSLSLIGKCGLGKDKAIIDVGGGASLLVDWLLHAGYRRVAVLDISPTSLEHARKRLGDSADAVEWFVDDITGFSPPHAFALWHDRAVFHFLTDAEDRRKYVEVLTKTLQPGGCLVLAAFAIGGPNKCSGLDVVQYDADKLLGELGDGFELTETVAERHMTPSNKEQLFRYYRLRRV